MICPVKLANEMSGLSGTLHRSMTRSGHEATERNRSGAGDETTGRNVAVDGQSGSPDFRQRRSSASVASRCSVRRTLHAGRLIKAYSIASWHTVLLLGAMAAFVKTSGLRKVVITFDDHNDEPPKRLSVMFGGPPC